MKTKYLLIVALLTPMMLFAKEDPKYLDGAVPEVDGKIVFAKEFAIDNADAAYDKLQTWLAERMRVAENNSSVAFADKEKGQILAIGREYIVFTDKALSLDRTLMTYNVHVTVSQNKAIVEIERIRYEYERKIIPAELQIADGIALNKKKTFIYPAFKKFRKRTVDFAEEYLNSAATALNVKE
jgi:hypothetical protein